MPTPDRSFDVARPKVPMRPKPRLGKCGDQAVKVPWAFALSASPSSSPRLQRERRNGTERDPMSEFGTAYFLTQERNRGCERDLAEGGRRKAVGGRPASLLLHHAGVELQQAVGGGFPGETGGVGDRSGGEPRRFDRVVENPGYCRGIHGRVLS